VDVRLADGQLRLFWPRDLEEISPLRHGGASGSVGKLRVDSGSYSPEYVEVEFCELRIDGVLRSSVALMTLSILRSVLLKHAAYILHQFIELPHLFLTKLLDAFVLYARYDLISYPPHLPSSLR
jgi:hypothetical protein